MNRKLLSIYLNDHLAGATAVVELARRSRGANTDNEFGSFLDRLSADVEYDRDALLELMGKLEIGRDRVKLGAAWTAEKAGRLKLNGSLTGYSPLSRLVELEGLLLGASANLTAWEVLEDVAVHDHRLADFDLKRFIERGRGRLEEIGKFRLRAAQLALVENPVQATLVED